MSLIILVRHGESTVNVKKILSDTLTGNPLTKLGKQQVKETGKALKNFAIDGFFTSPVLRARQTSTILSEYLDINAQIDKRLIERSFGKLCGSSNQVNSSWKFMTNMGIESFESLQKRMESFAYDQTQKSVILAVTHKDPIVALLAASLKLDELGSFSFSPTNASINIFELNNKKLRVILNGVSFLNEKMLQKIPKKYLVKK